MLQLIFSMFCFLGGKWVATFLMPLINPIMSLLSWLPLCLSVMSSGKSALNSQDGEKKSKMRAAQTTFISYYIIASIATYFLFQGACNIM